MRKCADNFHIFRFPDFHILVYLCSMIYTIYAPQSVRGKIQLPASKSISNRVLILNALSGNPQTIANLSESDDTQILKSALKSENTFFDIGAAGTSMRFLTSYLAQRPGEYILTGSERMKNRPIRILVDALKKIGADIDYLEKEGYPPLKIKGKKLNGGEIQLQSNVSSQYLSSLMMIAPCMENGLTVRLEGEIISEPYIRMTESLMNQFGVKIIREGNTLHIEPQSYVSTPFSVEADWSAASYMYEIAALASGDSSIVLVGLSENSLQGDAKVSLLFERLGVHSDFDDSNVKLTKSKSLPSQFAYDFTNEPDLAQTFIVTCCLLNTPFRFSGLQSLRIKETDRIHAMREEMRKLGYCLHLDTDNTLSWDGDCCSEEKDPVISTYEDHRMAMAFAPVALKNGNIKIANPEVVTKSYPGFWESLKKLGFTIESTKS